jgi:hypothetical protein
MSPLRSVVLDAFRASIDPNLYGPTVRALALPKHAGAAVTLDDVTVTHRWTDDTARQLYEAYATELREVQRKRAVDLGLSMDDGDEQTATNLLRQNRRLRMSERHRAEAWHAWQEVIDPLVRRMCDLHTRHTVPTIMVKK